MARILQIRRGTAAQNNDFTGLPGEITMDTDTKTLRIHDGETLGGFALARADDAATGTGTFDITTVSDDFWAEKIPEFVPAPYSVMETDNLSITDATAYMEYIAEIDRQPICVQSILVCLNDDAGYVAGDEVRAFGIGARCNPTPNIQTASDGARIRLMIGGDAFWVSHNTTGATTTVVAENWGIKFRVYY